MPLAVVELTPVTVGATVSMTIYLALASATAVPEPVATVNMAALGCWSPCR